MDRNTMEGRIFGPILDALFTPHTPLPCATEIEAFHRMTATTKTPVLVIVTDECKRVAVRRNDCEELYELFEVWRATPERTLSESATWWELLEKATNYLAEHKLGEFADDVETEWNPSLNTVR